MVIGPMMPMATDGVTLGLPPGWEAEVDGGAGNPEAGTLSLRTPRIHLANFALPAERGDFGSGAVERMTSGDVLICILEEAADAIGTRLFDHEGMPSLAVDDFAPDGMQRPIRGQSGAQKFFHVHGRAFALYAVMGSHLSRSALIDEVNAVLAAIDLK